MQRARMPQALCPTFRPAVARVKAHHPLLIRTQARVSQLRAQLLSAIRPGGLPRDVLERHLLEFCTWVLIS